MLLLELPVGGSSLEPPGLGHGRPPAEDQSETLVRSSLILEGGD